MKPYLLALMLLSGLAFSADEAPKKMLDFVQGKWVVDMDATLKDPIIKAELEKDKSAEAKIKMVMGSASYEFTKDTIIMTIQMMPKPITTTFKIVENTTKILTLDATAQGGGDKAIRIEVLFKDKDHIILPNPMMKVNVILKRPEEVGPKK